MLNTTKKQVLSRMKSKGSVKLNDPIQHEGDSLSIDNREKLQGFIDNSAHAIHRNGK